MREHGAVGEERRIEGMWPVDLQRRAIDRDVMPVVDEVRLGDDGVGGEDGSGELRVEGGKRHEKAQETQKPETSECGGWTPLWISNTAGGANVRRAITRESCVEPQHSIISDCGGWTPLWISNTAGHVNAG